jgi:transcriptional regulator with XRE-family HTH domain
MIGQKLRELRELKGLVQRQIAAELEVDTAYVSKIEGNEKPVSRQHLKKLSILLDISEDELLKHWIADKIFDVVKNEKLAIEALQLAKQFYLEQIETNRKGTK